jgi:hypothetical protein
MIFRAGVAMSVTDLLALASPVIALVGAAIGAGGAYFAGRRQAAAAVQAAERQNAVNMEVARLNIEASLVAGSRQRWIDELRIQLSALAASFYRLETVLARKNPIGYDGWIAELTTATEIETRVVLMLNPSEDEHALLSKMLWRTMNSLRAGQFTAENLAEIRVEITEKSQGVLKAEWERVKAVALTTLPKQTA